MARLFIDFLVHPTQSTSKKAYLKSAWAIHRVCELAAIRSRPTDKPLKGLGPFGVQASYRSVGHTKKRKRSVVISDSEGASGTPSEAEGHATDSEEETSTTPVPPFLDPLLPPLALPLPLRLLTPVLELY